MKESKEGADKGDIKETPSDENESPESDNTVGVDVPEEFQQAMHKHLSKATKPMLAHARSKVSMREDELRDQEMATKGKDGKMTSDDAPSSMGM